MESQNQNSSRSSVPAQARLQITLNQVQKVVKKQGKNQYVQFMGALADFYSHLINGDELRKRVQPITRKSLIAGKFIRFRIAERIKSINRQNQNETIDPDYVIITEEINLEVESKNQSKQSSSQKSEAIATKIKTESFVKESEATSTCAKHTSQSKLVEESSEATSTCASTSRTISVEDHQISCKLPIDLADESELPAQAQPELPTAADNLILKGGSKKKKSSISKPKTILNCKPSITGLEKELEDVRSTQRLFENLEIGSQESDNELKRLKSGHCPCSNFNVLQENFESSHSKVEKYPSMEKYLEMSSVSNAINILCKDGFPISTITEGLLERPFLTIPAFIKHLNIKIIQLSTKIEQLKIHEGKRKQKSSGRGRRKN